MCKVGDGSGSGSGPVLEFWGTGVEVSVASGSGICCNVASWAFRGRGYGTSWAWEAALLAYFVFVGSGWNSEFGTGAEFLDAAGRVGGWVGMERS